MVRRETACFHLILPALPPRLQGYHQTAEWKHPSALKSNYSPVCLNNRSIIIHQKNPASNTAKCQHPNARSAISPAALYLLFYHWHSLISDKMATTSNEISRQILVQDRGLLYADLLPAPFHNRRRPFGKHLSVFRRTTMAIPCVFYLGPVCRPCYDNHPAPPV